MTTARSRKKSDPSHCFDRCLPSGSGLLGHCETDRDSFIVLRPRLRKRHNLCICNFEKYQPRRHYRSARAREWGIDLRFLVSMREV